MSDEEREEDYIPSSSAPYASPYPKIEVSSAPSSEVSSTVIFAQ